MEKTLPKLGWQSTNLTFSTITIDEKKWEDELGEEVMCLEPFGVGVDIYHTDDGLFIGVGYGPYNDAAEALKNGEL